MNKTKKIMVQDTKEIFVEFVIEFATLNGMTINNILESIEEIIEIYMDNAELKSDD